ncbi:hypothetical protein LOK49_LG14G01194 [Camellia lanceoleosa]|uniref:Uncharacterized protein n=1 Tax=Camellia lanceoleosa TaxID=1840588 RepID=A0ACC0FCZ3_9ERIC|nr:hypothetical protein LOK49_LG14G01194 [Camellia lanceoleosa]
MFHYLRSQTCEELQESNWCNDAKVANCCNGDVKVANRCNGDAKAANCCDGANCDCRLTFGLQTSTCDGGPVPECLVANTIITEKNIDYIYFSSHFSNRGLHTDRSSSSAKKIRLCLRPCTVNKLEPPLHTGGT